MPFPAARLARYELRRFRGVMPRLALAFVVLVPLLYGAIYLSASWDPYGKLDHLQVAVVNEDVPTTINDERIAAGEDLVANLAAHRTFDWQFVDAATADAGLKEGRYYMIVTIEKDFSANLVSGAGDDPQRARVLLRRDDANGFVIGSITARAEDSIERQVDAAAQESYFEAVFTNLRTIRDNLLKASDGAGQLESGLTEAHQGSQALVTSLGTAEKGAQTLATGAGTAHEASQQLSGGLHQLTTASGELATGATQVAEGTQKLNNTVLPPLTELEKHLPALESDAKQVSSGAAAISESVAGRSSSIATDVEQAQARMAALEKANPELADDPQWQELKQRLASANTRTGEVAERTGTIAEHTAALNSRIQQTNGLSGTVATARQDLEALNSGAHRVAAGAGQLHTGIERADSGATELTSGLAELETGAGELHGGLTELRQGATKLDQGLATLQEGASTLHTSLADGARRIPVFTAAEEAEAIQVLASPADVESTVDHAAEFYGRGLAPMFFSIALWVFGISVFLVVRPITGRTLAGRASPLRLAFTAWLPIATLAVTGGLIMVATVWLALGLDPVRAPEFLGITVLGALCFSAIAHLLRTTLGTPGSSILLVWLILQLASAGGTYPSPVLPPFFSAIGPAMPMTYLIDAFRVTISGGQTAHLVRDVVLLATVTVLTLALTTLAVSLRRRFAMKDLHPPLVAP
ncbi:YhgE/Pip family protein [Microlunatus sp. Y2014]|uniref:YhgE/Pip family protein n=1 Tax=Microlunatus sp. Y2014 TaxID=3418488 RepID=UPI003DA7A5B0